MTSIRKMYSRRISQTARHSTLRSLDGSFGAFTGRFAADDDPLGRHRVLYAHRGRIVTRTDSSADARICTRWMDAS